MRTVLVLLLLANLTLFAYTRLDGGSGGEAVRLAEQVQPDKIKLLTPQEVAALGPAKVAALADVCVELGPFSEGDRARALADLASEIDALRRAAEERELTPELAAELAELVDAYDALANEMQALEALLERLDATPNPAR